MKLNSPHGGEYDLSKFSGMDGASDEPHGEGDVYCFGYTQPMKL